MSLEQALAENTLALNRLASILQSGALPTGAASTGAEGAAETATTTKSTRGRKAAETPPAGTQTATTAAAGVTVNDGKSELANRLVDDPQGTRYFHIAGHKTVAKIKPGEVIPSLPGMEEVTGTQYEVWRTSYAAPVPPAGAATTSGAAAAPASSTPAAGPASSPASAQPQPATTTGPATTSPTLDGPGLTAKCQALHKAQGNAGLKKVLDKFAVTNVPGLIAKTAEYAAIATFIDELLTPPAAAAPAEVNLFG